MKRLMRSYVYSRSMDRDTESLVKSCKGYALAAKAPPIKFNQWPENDCPWSRLHIGIAGTLNGSYYLIVVQFFKEAIDIEMQETRVVIGFLHELFAKFGVHDSIFEQYHLIYIKRIQVIL